MDGRIVSAITNRKVLTFTYAGAKLEVEPHCYGLDFRGAEAIYVWQTSYPKPGWKLLHVDKMGLLQSTAKKFAGPRPGYKRDQVAMKQIYCQV